MAALELENEDLHFFSHLKGVVIDYCRGSYRKHGPFCDRRQIREEAEDIFSEVMEKILHARYDPTRASFYTFLSTILRNKVTDRRRKFIRRRENGLVYVNDANRYIERYGRYDKKNCIQSQSIDRRIGACFGKKLQSALNNLDVFYREALLAKLESEHGKNGDYYKNIAQKYDKKEETVRSWACRAYDKLIKQLGLIPFMQEKLGRPPTKKEIKVVIKAIVEWGKQQPWWQEWNYLNPGL